MSLITPGEEENNSPTSAAIRYLRSPRAIRERCDTILQAGLSDRLTHFSVDLQRLPPCVDLVRGEILQAYPDLNVPFHSRWRHFDVGDVQRTAFLDDQLKGVPSDVRARAKFELAIVSVLLDAGAGPTWRYHERGENAAFGRSEGLAVASLDAFRDGTFGLPCEVTAEGLITLTPKKLAEAFQVTQSNPLVGVDGRTALLNRLGQVICDRGEAFPWIRGRLGGLVDHLATLVEPRGLSASRVLETVLDVFAPIWPGRITLEGHNLGDIWRHSSIVTDDATSGLVPLHKLSQWLTYSLLEPLEEAGVHVVDLNELTGLAEYRNGGLLIDSGVLQLKDAAELTRTHPPSSELIVEWRALTVSLLDRIASGLRERLGVDAEQLPLVKVLQGGTWSVGRRLAAVRSSDASPPLKIESDGTVF